VSSGPEEGTIQWWTVMPLKPQHGGRISSPYFYLNHVRDILLLPTGSVPR